MIWPRSHSSTATKSGAEPRPDAFRCKNNSRPPFTCVITGSWEHTEVVGDWLCPQVPLPSKTQSTVSIWSSKGTTRYILKLVSCPLAGDYTSDLFPEQISLFYTEFASYTELYNTVIVSVCPPQWAPVTLYNTAADLCSDRVKHKGQRTTTQQLASRKKISFYKLIRTQLPFLACALSPGAYKAHINRQGMTRLWLLIKLLADKPWFS